MVSTEVLNGIPMLPDEIQINGITFTGPALIAAIQEVTNPDPRYWYNFKRDGSKIFVTRKMD